jgi:FAD/FMN-containing dehydrogenase
VTNSIPSGDLERFRSAFSGDVLIGSDAGYDEARAVHNGLIDRRPAVIARCRTTADVVESVKLAADAGLEVSVRGGGHNVAGRAVTEGGLMIDLAGMKDVQVDATARTARAEGGATWADYNNATHAHGLASTGGVVSTTGIAGLTLGGGLGWLMGRYGMAVDALRAAEVVMADGVVRTASADEDSDLFWAIRGGGGNFGVATALEYDLQPLTDIYGGLIAFDLSAAADVGAFYRDAVPDDPDELTTFMALTHAPDGSGHKIAALAICHCGDLADGEKAVAPARSVATPLVDLLGPLPYPVVNTLLDAAFPKGARNYWKSAFFKELSAEAVETMLDCFRRTPSIMTGMVIEHFHGAVTRVAATDTAYPHREPGFNLVLATQWADPADDDVNIAWTRETFDALAPFTADAAYVNYLNDDEGDRVRSAYGPNWERLVELKRRYDPGNFFHMNQNIRP